MEKLSASSNNSPHRLKSVGYIGQTGRSACEAAHLGGGDPAVSLGETEAANENDDYRYINMDPSGNELGSSHPVEPNSNLAVESIVVETGSEQKGKGKWTTVEQENFLSALQTYGKEWTKVAAAVKTRTRKQTQDHGYRYCLNLQKAMGNKGEDGDSLLYGLATTDTKKTPQKRKSKSPTKSQSTKSQLGQAQQAQLAEATAHLIPHMSSNAATSAAPHRIFSEQMNPAQTMEAESFHPPDGMDMDNTKKRTCETMESIYADCGKEDVLEQAVQSLEHNLAQGPNSGAT
eukprot:scaffold5959_cov49-Attheya_sp.AAC.3